MAKQRVAKPAQSLKDVRRWLAEVLGLTDVPDSLWHHEHVEGPVKAYLASGRHLTDIRTAAEALVGESQRITRDYRESQQVTREHNDRPAPVPQADHFDPGWLTEAEQARCHAFEAYIARLAGERHDVMQVRNTLIGGIMLATGDVMEFLCSPLRRFPTVAQYQGCASEENGTFADIIEETDDRIWMRMPASDEPFCVARGSDRALCYPIENRRLGYLFRYWAGSAIEELWTVADNLTAAYGWDRLSWAYFLLADKRPTYQPFTVGTRFSSSATSGRAQAEIVATFAPWLTERSVRTIYRATRDKPVHGHATITRISPRAFRAYAWVLDHCAGTEGAIDWKRSAAQWNAEHDGAERFAYPSHFRRNFEQVAPLIVEMLML